MLSATSILALGFLIGMRHALDPDHVVAVSTIVSQQRSLTRASLVGALWGLGHTATILLVGGAMLVFRLAIPPRLGLALEFAVAVMLVVLGIRNLRREAPDAGAHSNVRPVAVGFVHGLAGSAFVAVLVLNAIREPLLGLVYLLVFGVGTIAGMTMVTAAIAVPSTWAMARVGSMQRYLRMASGVASVAFGLVLAHQIGVVDGLFSADPQWQPK
jgi:high-affinity nickel permease